jgi:formamidopyrimidine-DNA glycosylase
VPELPEVETTRRGIEPHLLGQVITRVDVRDRRLRWPVTDGLIRGISGQRILAVGRRAKYLLLQTAPGCMLLHLGMSGSLRIVNASIPPDKHDHVDFVLGDGRCLRLRDPRRFGSLHWTTDVQGHPLLASLGPEPWDPEFTGAHLHDRAQGRTQAIKNFIMDSHIVVGVGNIYASEVLFATGIRPQRAAGKLSRVRYETLVTAIQDILARAITQGGTTLRDFVNSEGKPGYFRQELQVYDRAGEACRRCGAAVRCTRIGQRASYYCSRCQT